MSYRENYDFSDIEKQPPKSLTFIFRVVFIVVVFILGAFSYRLAEEKGYIQAVTPQVQGVSESVDMVDTAAKISRLLLINTEEKPSVATIVDVEKLKASGTTFYENAKAGDKLVIYSDKAIIFREEDNLIINIVPITRTNDSAKNSNPTPTPS